MTIRVSSVVERTYTSVIIRREIVQCSYVRGQNEPYTMRRFKNLEPSADFDRVVTYRAVAVQRGRSEMSVNGICGTTNCLHMHNSDAMHRGDDPTAPAAGTRGPRARPAANINGK